MMTFKNIGFIAIISLLFVGCKNETKPEIKTVETDISSETVQLNPNAVYAKAEFGIEGMTCPMGCAKSIEKKLSKMDGVKSATVDFDTRLAMVEYDEAKVTPTSLEETVKKTGDMYSVKDMKTVASFSTETKECKPGCTMACCADKAKEGNAMADTKACAADCKKACCADKNKA